MQADDFPGVPWLRVFWRAVKVEAPDGPEGLAVRFTLDSRLPSFLDYTTIGLCRRISGSGCPWPR